MSNQIFDNCWASKNCSMGMLLAFAGVCVTQAAIELNNRVTKISRAM